jgi:teichuronic acid biosynthesis glycosyltransferase TuaG
MNALVSIVMPAYGAESSLAETLDGVLAQSYPHWELLLLVDASPDRTGAIARQYAAADPRIRLLAGRKNRGVVRARNLCMRLARGSWIAFCDADDCWQADKLEKQLGLLDKTKADFCYTSATYHRPDLNWESTPARMPERLNLKRLMQGNPIGMSTVLVSRQLLQGMYFDDLPVGIVHEDYAFWVKLFQSKSITPVYLPEATTRVSIHPATRSGNKMRALRSQLYILRQYGRLSVSRSFFYLITYLFWAFYKRGWRSWLRQLR